MGTRKRVTTIKHCSQVRFLIRSEVAEELLQILDEGKLPLGGG